MRRCAFENPDLGLCFEHIYIMGVGSLKNFFSGPQKSGSQFLSDRSTQPTKIENFFGVKRVNPGGQNELKKFSINVSKVFGT